MLPVPTDAAYPRVDDALAQRQGNRDSLCAAGHHPGGDRHGRQAAGTDRCRHRYDLAARGGICAGRSGESTLGRSHSYYDLAHLLSPLEVVVRIDYLVESEHFVDGGAYDPGAQSCIQEGRRAVYDGRVESVLETDVAVDGERPTHRERGGPSVEPPDGDQRAAEFGRLGKLEQPRAP